MSPKAYSYIRFSSPEQAKGDSYRRQREAAEQYCAANGLELVNSRDYLFFDKGRSAYKGKHLDDTGELARFLSYVENGTIPTGSFLLVESLDRLSREKVKDALPRFLDLLNKGINVYTLADSKLYTSEYNELDLIISIVHMSRAHSESSIKGQRVSKAWKEKQRLAREAKTPLGAGCPYWLTFQDGTYQPIPERVRAVKEIFSLAEKGHGQRAIAKILNEQGIPVFGSTARNLSGKWGSSSTSKILTNRALLGEYQPTGLVDGVRQDIGEVVVGFYPAVITEADFYAAQASRLARTVSKATKPSKNFNIWQGVAKCKLCDAPMHLLNKGKPPKGAKYLRCYNSAKGVCAGKIIRLDRSEEVFRELLVKVDSLSLVQDSQGQLQREVSVLGGRVLEVQSRLDDLQAQATAVGKLPTMLVGVMVQLEEELNRYISEREEVKAHLSRDRILSKKDFFSSLDLVSFEGRAKANALLKSLEITVKVGRTRRAKSPIDITYNIYQQGKPFLHMRDDAMGLLITPLRQDIAELSLLQGDDYAATILERLECMPKRPLRPGVERRGITMEMIEEVHQQLIENISSGSE